MKLQTGLILANINKHISLEQHEIKYFLSLLHFKELEKKEPLLKAGEPCTMFSYVSSGALRAFYRDEVEKEATIMFALADWWVTDMPSFVSQSPAMIHIEAITKSNVLQLSKADMDTLYVKVPKFERFFRILMQNAYVREQLRTIQNLSLPAGERYHHLLQKYPLIIRQVPLKNIASYLGVTPEFLSVIRGKGRKGIS